MLGGSNKVTIDVLCLCGTTLRIRNVDTYILFYVLWTCTHDVTPWWDFLHFHSTLTDSEKVYVRIYISYYSEPSPPIALRMCAADTKRCASHTPMYLHLYCIPARVDGEYLFSPNVAVLLGR